MNSSRPNRSYSSDPTIDISDITIGYFLILTGWGDGAGRDAGDSDELSFAPCRSVTKKISSQHQQDKSNCLSWCNFYRDYYKP